MEIILQHSLHETLFVQQEILIRAGGFGVDAPATPISAAARDTLRGSIICHVSIPDSVTGQIKVTLRPLYELRNMMPCSIQMRLSQDLAGDTSF